MYIPGNELHRRDGSDGDAGCVVVGTSLGALPETAWRNPLVVPQVTDG
jgi:hypothetical protein